MKTAIAFSTKDRTEFTAQTLPRILDEAEGNFDLFWLDGSVTQQGMNFPAEFAYKYRNEHDGKYPLKALHQNVGGGPAAVIQAAWKFMYDAGYDYIGLIENDVLLEKNWFKRCMELFDKKIHDRVEVGAVSARCFTDRIHRKYEDYAWMANVGAGMHITKSEFILPLLEEWHRPLLWVMQQLWRKWTDNLYPVPPQIKEEDRDKTWIFTDDWWWEFTLMKRDHVTLACVPSMAINLDDLNGERDRVEK